MDELIRNIAPLIGAALISLIAWLEVRRIHKPRRPDPPRNKRRMDELIRNPPKPVARPEAEPLDPAALHARTMKRFPKIMAKLHEYELREEREKRKPD